MWSVAILVICGILQNGFKPADCWKTCPKNEEYVDNVNPCNSCEYLDGECLLSGETGPGCDCIKGLYRNQDGVCVDKSDCGAASESTEQETVYQRPLNIGPGKTKVYRTSPVRPVSHSVVCREDEEFQECGCLRTCCNRGKSEGCAAQCTSGCFCKPPLVRNDVGGCVPLKDCKKSNNTGGCGKNEVYNECGTACPKTCSNRNAAIKCISKCVKGCFCKEGYVRNDAGKCVKPNQCPLDTCGINEIYKKCGTACPERCPSKFRIGIVCPQKCVEGCFCKDGYVRNNDNKCVKPNQCPPLDTCGTNEVYKECGTACPERCPSKFRIGIVCPQKCVKGCFCEDGYVRNNDNQCVKPNQCPPLETCGVNEMYNECGTGCPLTCDNMDDPPICSLRCVSGCFCQPGLVRNSEGRCVEPYECPVGECGTNEVYKECGTACPKTCANRNVQIRCIDKCVEGCFCKDGYVRNDDGKCVQPDQCPSDTCGLGEEYNECGTACPLTCENKDNPAPQCIPLCVPGCFCLPGLVRNNDGICVEPNECQTDTCGKNEVFKTCGTACPETCADMTKTSRRVCTRQCVKGCFCKDGYVRNNDGQCVRRNQCPKETCPKNEVYSTCVNPCNDCKIRGKCQFLVCNKGCDCKKGYHRGKDGKCILASQCPNKPTIPPKCGKDEQYYQCIPSCNQTCEAYAHKEIKACKTLCRSGCFCKRGLYKRKDGKCVRPSQCGIPTTQPGVCSRNEEYKDCGSSCEVTCSNRFIDALCTSQCVKGCFCKEGYIRNDNGKCVKPSECGGETCGIGEEYTDCGTACPLTCDNVNNPPEVCTLQCVPGCFCLPGLVRSNEGRCVEPYECPTDICAINEVYKECGTACPKTCANRNIKISCIDNCVEGCFCKDGYVRNDAGLCVEPNQCPPETCGVGEEYTDCGTACPLTCDNINNPEVCTLQCVPGCFCQPGLARNNQGRCVEPDKCPIDTCGINEFYIECGTACPERFPSKFKIGIVCPQKCIEGCFCKDGYLRNIENKCVKPNQCPPLETCGVGEEYTDCGTACPLTCDNINDPPEVCTLQCVPGCFCLPGLVRNNEGRCVEPYECPIATLPPSGECQKDEKWYECIPGCQSTCSVYTSEFPIACRQPCRPGCFCKEGLYQTDDGKCVPPHKCPHPTKQPGLCGINEIYNECGTACPETCSDKGKSRPCTKQCISGCFCKKGYVRNNAGQCINRKKCPTDECGINENYKQCGTACPETCSNRGQPQVCSKQCVKGCFCNEGYVRNSNGVCVKPSECPTEQCGFNEAVVGCAKPKFCNTCEIRGNCKLKKCDRGCDCLEGYFRNKTGICIAASQCPSETCPENEEYSDCVVPCNDCYTRGECEFLVCNPGCDCMEGFFRDAYGKCVPKSQCPPTQECGVGEEYTDCGTACPLTCGNVNNPPEVCTLQCVPGCFCQPGLVRNNEGRCIEPYECPTDTCGINEVYKKCGTACPKTCANRNIKISCIDKCVEGCFCKDGYVRNDAGLCVEPNQCLPETCGVGEEYDDCGTACPLTCDNINDPPEVCTLQCVPGCFCLLGLVRNNKGRCVEPQQCKGSTKPTKPPTCGQNEVYSGCIPTCRNTCENYNATNPICSRICIRGCHCKKGYVKRKDGKCVKPFQCTEPTKPTKSPTCGKNEVYSGCIPTCRNTCENYNATNPICSRICIRGCHCKKGYVKRKDGKCVKPSQCNEPTKPTKPPIHTCGRNEQYYECVPTCKDTCENYDDEHSFCSLICRPGCSCKKGYVKRHDGKCVKPSQCSEPTQPTKPPPHTCGKNEKYYECAPTCKDTCENYDAEHPICPLICISGCACKDGYVKRGDGKCVKPSQCSESTKPTKPPPHTCGKNEKYYECVPTCKDTCENYDAEHPICPLICISGCACKDGYVKREDGKCVKPSQCTETTKPTKPPPHTCGKNEKYYECIPTCKDTCENYDDEQSICPLYCRSGCACKEGYVKREDGKCVKPSQCIEPTKPTPPPTCGVNEEYSGCIPTCRNTCENYDAEYPLCSKICIRGCHCKKGYVKRKDGRCVKPSQCNESTKPTKPPPHTCGKDEKYYECVPTCKDTCENYDDEQSICPLYCRSGCACKEGYVKRKDGKCVKPSQCNESTKPTKPPPHTCGKNEKYYECVPTCKDTCENYDDEQSICPLYCRSGCACKEGYVKRKDGKCVKPSQCNESTKPTKPPPLTCGMNEKYFECVPTCKDTCENYDDEQSICPLYCRSGCACKEGYVKRKDGKCVKPSQCNESTKPTKPPPHTCGKNEKYYECAPTCKDTCENYDAEHPICPLICISGCACKDGYVKREDGKCVKPSQCSEPTKPTKPPTCGVNEEYSGCVPTCRNTCENYDAEYPICSKICIRGCHCKKGYVKRKDGRCVRPSQCTEPNKPTKPPPHICGKNEKYYECVPTCKDTCENYDDEQSFCPLYCRSGCACKEGYVKRKDGKCVKTSQCAEPTKPTKPPVRCGKDEEFYDCLPTCNDTCANYNIPDQGCSYVCRPGCFCKKGLIKNDEGKCVKPSECPQTTKPPIVCGKDEVYYDDCAPACGGTCDTYGHEIHCPLCRPGCWCKKGMVKNKEGKCVKPSKCSTTHPTEPSTTCGKDEIYYDECAPSCGGTCDTYGLKIACPLCRPGCWCKKGMVKNQEGKCVQPSKCPTTNPTEPSTTCGKDEVYYDECAPSCGGTCDTYGHEIHCPLCKPGCWCKKGMVKNKEGKCVKPSTCPNTNPTEPPTHTCGAGEDYYDCVPTCRDTCENYNSRIAACPEYCRSGCACKKGLVKRKDGKCVKPSQCQEHTKATRHPTYPTHKPTKPLTTCGKFEVFYEECAPSCHGTCDTYDEDSIECPKCRPGCWCKKGLVKAKDGKCIPPIKCPTTKPTQPSTTCSKDEIYYDDCAPSCGGTCETYGNHKSHCPLCKPGCWCKKGMVKNKEGKCVKPSKCPNTNPTMPIRKCPKNQQYYVCAPTCRRTCMTYNSTFPYCNKECMKGCFCKDGFVMDKLGNCIKPEECPISCGMKQQLYKCMPDCTNRCNPPDVCDTTCRPGCFCKEGLVLREKDNRCVKKKYCDMKENECGKNKEYYECYSSCRNSCAGRKNKDLVCPAVCEKGCFCKKGLLSDSKGNCVKPDKCNRSESEEWSESESYSSEESSSEHWSSHKNKTHKHYEHTSEEWSYPGGGSSHHGNGGGHHGGGGHHVGEGSSHHGGGGSSHHGGGGSSHYGGRGSSHHGSGGHHGGGGSSHHGGGGGSSHHGGGGSSDHGGGGSSHHGGGGSSHHGGGGSSHHGGGGSSHHGGGGWSQHGEGGSSHHGGGGSSQHGGDYKTCKPNEEFSPCNAHCQKDCSNWKEDNIPCTKICKPGCVCKKGWVRGPEGHCILPKHCFREDGKSSKESNEKDSKHSTGSDKSGKKESDHIKGSDSSDKKASNHKIGSSDKKESDHKKGSNSSQKKGSEHSHDKVDSKKGSGSSIKKSSNVSGKKMFGRQKSGDGSDTKTSTLDLSDKKEFNNHLAAKKSSGGTNKVWKTSSESSWSNEEESSSEWEIETSGENEYSETMTITKSGYVSWEEEDSGSWSE